MDIAHVRILRLALGTGLSLWVSQAVAWDLSFIAPVMTLFILALPLPALSLKMGIQFLAAMTLSMYASVLLFPSMNFPPIRMSPRTPSCPTFPKNAAPSSFGSYT